MIHTSADGKFKNIRLSEEWIVFAAFNAGGDDPWSDNLREPPETLVIGNEKKAQTKIKPRFGQIDLASFVSGDGAGLVAYIYLKIHSERETDIPVGMGWGNWIAAWIDGQKIDNGLLDVKMTFPPRIRGHIIDLHIKEGENLLVVKASLNVNRFLIALGDRDKMVRGDFNRIMTDPFAIDKRWRFDRLPVGSASKEAIDIGNRRELFIDSWLIDNMSSVISRRLHHPQPRECVIYFGEKGRPWEGNATYPTILKHNAKFLLYYSGRPKSVADESDEQMTCVAESRDGVNFTRPDIGIFEFDGSKRNNIIWMGKGGHNFAPFIDRNPDTDDNHIFKAIAYHPTGGSLGAYSSPDGVSWGLFAEKPIIFPQDGNLHFDSHNIAFWDTNIQRYVCYFRNRHKGIRWIMRCDSTDFIHWDNFSDLEFTNEVMVDLYTSCIAPYFRAPHIYLGTPVRFLPYRVKCPEHPLTGVNDAILISSRDGKIFERWDEGFIIPGIDLKVWTDRNNYPAWGMVRTSDEETSLYWDEHNRHESKRIRRGVIRTDGYVSLHAGGDVGEALTRPIIFSGSQLEVNYSTSAAGTIKFELCDINGEVREGFSYEDSEAVFGNEIKHIVRWYGLKDMRELAGKPVRLRIRIHDADLYSFRFTNK